MTGQEIIIKSVKLKSAIEGCGSTGLKSSTLRWQGKRHYVPMNPD